MSAKYALQRTFAAGSTTGPGATVFSDNPKLHQTTRGEPNAYVRGRQREQVRVQYDHLQAKLADDALKTEFENSSDSRIRTNNIKKIANQLERQDKDSLRARQDRLAALLAQDEVTYRKEIAGLQETPDQRVRRLTAVARALKQEREAKRKALAQELYNRQWRESCDDLRLLDSRQITKGIVKEVGRQLLEKDEIKRRTIADEKKWAEESLAEKLRKDAVAYAEVEEEKRRAKENKASLDQQQAFKQSFIEAHRSQIAHEREQFRRAILEDQEAHQRNLVAEKMAARERMEKLKKYNAEIGEAREKIAKMEKQQDATDLLKKIEMHRAETLAAQASKQSRITGIRDYQDYLAQRKAEERKMEQELEVLVAIENQKIMEKEDMMREREEVARRNLMVDVMRQRDGQIALHEREKLRTLREKEIDAENLHYEMMEGLELEREQRAKHFLKGREIVKAYDQQIQLAADLKAMEKAQAVQEFSKTQAAEIQYAAYLNREKQRTEAAGFVSRKYGIKSTNWD